MQCGILERGITEVCHGTYGLKVLESCIYVQLTQCEEEITEICHSTSSSCSGPELQDREAQSHCTHINHPGKCLIHLFRFWKRLYFFICWFRFRWADTINLISFVIFYLRNMGYLVILKEMSISVNLKSVILPFSYHSEARTGQKIMRW